MLQASSVMYGLVGGLAILLSLGPATCRQHEEPRPTSKGTSPMTVVRTLTYAELATPLDPPEDHWTGVLEHVRFRRHAGDADPQGSWEEWLVIRIDDRRLPIRVGSTAELASVRAERISHRPRPFPVMAAESPAPLLDPAEGAERGIFAGDRVRVKGVSVPVLFTGGVAMKPVYGIFTADVEKLS